MSRRSSASVFGGAQLLQLLRRLAQLDVEAAHPEPNHYRLHSAHKAGAFAHQVLVLAAGTPGIFLGQRRDCRHAAVLRLPTQPAQEGTLEQRGVQSIRLRAPMLARHRDTVRVDDVRLDSPRPQPPRQPKAVAPSLERQHDPLNLAARLDRFVLPTMQQLQQRVLIRA
jgi:hypothetical protein